MEDLLLFERADDWQNWLAENHDRSAGEWLQFAKKGSGIRSVTYAEAVEEALCFGWIDGQKKKGSDGFWLQRFTPRGKRSIWSKINRAKAIALIGAGRMQLSGLAAIECAKECGRWEAAYDGHASAEVPQDLAAALRKSRPALVFFAKLSSQNRYAILFRLQTAKKPETRAARLEKFVGMLKRGETIYPQRES